MGSEIADVIECWNEFVEIDKVWEEQELDDEYHKAGEYLLDRTITAMPTILERLARVEELETQLDAFIEEDEKRRGL